MREGRFILILGKQRAGKTMLMSNLARKEFDKGRSIFTNIAYTFDYEPLYFQDLDLNDPDITDKIRGSVVTLDEIWMLMDARSSNSKPNKKFSRWLYQVKKMGVDLYGTTHDLYLIDKRARENFDYVIEVEALPTKRLEGVPPERLFLTTSNGPLQRYFFREAVMPITPSRLNLFDTENIFDPLERPSEPIPNRKPLNNNYSKVDTGRARIPRKFDF